MLILAMRTPPTSPLAAEARLRVFAQKEFMMHLIRSSPNSLPFVFAGPLLQVPHLSFSFGIIEVAIFRVWSTALFI